jgi:DNA-binding IclR family transcriptional regulator
VFLAHQKRESIKPVLKAELSQMDDSKPTPSDIAAVSEAVRRDGYAAIDGQVFHGIRAIAAPVFDAQGEMRAAMSLVSNQSTLVKFPNPILADLLSTAKRISQRLGWQP